MRPYDNIMAAEEQHLSWLKAEYKTRGLAFPNDGSAAHVVVPADLKVAAQAGVDAEIANIAMYKAFLARPELSRPENAPVKTLFDQLMRASENHLRAFQTQLSKYR
jgi:rubrerythrin